MKKRQHFFNSGHFAFLKAFLKHPCQIGSVIPSSRFLERRIIETAMINSARTIVELGPGNGGTTRAILRAASSRAKLLSIELNPHLHALVNGIEDGRLIAHHGDAHSLKEILAHYGLEAPQAVISGIPFSTMDAVYGSQILKTIDSILAPGGCFVAYQVRERVATLCRPFLGQEEVALEMLNIPPMRVYRWHKKKLTSSNIPPL